jgi:flavin-dependent dehydrogenase
MPSSIDILYDATIVGAGPAGSVVAYGLAKKGISVLLLEKENFPRIKPCGGGVTAKAAQLLPFDLKNVIENTISGIKYSYKLGPEKERNYGHRGRGGREDWGRGRIDRTNHGFGNRPGG